MRIVALDLSLTATGVADETGARTIRPKTTGMERLAWVQATLMHALHGSCWERHARDERAVTDNPLVDLVVIEGYSLGTARQNSHAHALGELGGVVRLALWETGIPYVDVAPASVKKYALGKGGGKGTTKLDMGIAASKRLGYDSAAADDNEVDALWMWHMAMDAYGLAVVTMPAINRDALAGVKWPRVAAPVSA